MKIGDGSFRSVIKKLGTPADRKRYRGTLDEIKIEAVIVSSNAIGVDW